MIMIIIKEYRTQGIFNVISIGTNKVLELIKTEPEDKSYQVVLTTCDANRYVKVIEIMVKFVKERIRVVWLAMTYNIIPKRLTIGMLHCVVILMNSLPCMGGLHSVLSQKEIVTGKKFIRCPKI